MAYYTEVLKLLGSKAGNSPFGMCYTMKQAFSAALVFKNEINPGLWYFLCIWMWLVVLKKSVDNMPDSCLYTIWFENIPCWISLVYYSCYLDHINAIYWRAFWLNHIFAIHTDCITGVVKSNVWRPPLGHKMQARMDSNAVLWTTGLCSQKKIREKVREQRLVREGLQDNITSFLKFLRGHQRSFLLIYAKTLADMEKHCTDVWLL